MSLTIILLRDKIKVEMPVSLVIDYIKRRTGGGRRFKMITISEKEARAYYAYRDTFYSRMGYSVTYVSELKITNDPANDFNTIIEFKVPRLRKMLYALMAVFIVVFFSFASPDTALHWRVVILVTLYLGVVVNFNSQLSYLQSDIDQMSKNFKTKG